MVRVWMERHLPRQSRQQSGQSANACQDQPQSILQGAVICWECCEGLHSFQIAQPRPADAPQLETPCEDGMPTGINWVHFYGVLQCARSFCHLFVLPFFFSLFFFLLVTTVKISPTAPFFTQSRLSCPFLLTGHECEPFLC